MKVFCYRNLNRKGVVWSVKSTQSGLVVDRSKNVFISNVDLVVSAAGRKRVLRQKRKNVHAGVRGKRLKSSPKNVIWHKVTYNPYLYESFVFADNKTPVLNAKYAKLNKFGLWIGW
jgi:hypothetical protein